MGLDERLEQLGADVRSEPTPGVDVAAALRSTRARRTDRRRHRRLVGAGAAVTCIAVAAGVLLASASDDGDGGEAVVADSGGDEGTSSPPPEPATPDAVQLWVSASQVPAGTAELAVALTNPTDRESPTFGVDAQLERWDGTRWAPHRQVRLCVDFWLCRGDLAPLGDPLEVEAIGLMAPAGGVGPTLWLPVAELDVGAYRLVVDGAENDGGGELLHTLVRGRFDVVEAGAGDPQPPPRPLDGVGLTVGPPVVPRAGAPVRLDIAGVGSSAEIEAIWRSFDDPDPANYPRLERWRGGGWEPVASFGGVQPIEGETITRQLVLPPLEDGAYRLVAVTVDGTELEGRLWVTDLFVTSTAPAALAAGAVDDLDPGPLAPRNEAAVAVAGDVVVVWGGAIEGFNVGRPELGDAIYDDGAAYDVATGEWTPLPPAPLPASPAPTAVAAGDEVVVFSGGRAAAWSVTAQAWRSLPDPPVAPQHAFADGAALVVLGPGATGGGYLPAGAATWEPIPAPPVADDHGVAWTGEELVAVGAPGPGGSVASAVAFRPGDADWRPLPDVELGQNEVAIDATWTGSEVVVVGYDMNVVAFDPSTESWRRLPSLPVRFYEGSPEVHSVDGVLTVARLPAIAVLDDVGWVPLPQPTFGLLRHGVVVGDAVYSFAFDGDRSNRFARFRPAAAAADPPMIQVGSARLALGDDDRVERSEAAPSSVGTGGLLVSLRTASGTCTVQADFNIGDVDHTPAGRSDGAWEGVVAGDRIVVACIDPADAERLAAGVLPSDAGG